MNITDLMEVIRHVRKNMRCPHCNKRYNTQDISILASTKLECLLELRCQYCKKAVLTDLVATPKDPTKRNDTPEVPLINQLIKNGITTNDVLDTKIFLERFDGDFKKLFDHKN